ncbi:uncharacterized protein LAJ45_06475 [Morchella importuna]|uniref:uncharacterized protein n=1 Tax=Morchella importuna TaxID=1174673 RepID=UPI001E8E89D5|nr:uncharacterized protein LAJ45_06475 [Morchella importuna]KAH8149396.1 hypothetical protein LAJ45_06475 [Morchella importuna]
MPLRIRSLAIAFVLTQVHYAVFKPLAVLPYDSQTHKAAANAVAPVRTVVLAGQQNQLGKTPLADRKIASSYCTFLSVDLTAREVREQIL